jgi:hypothetical protein
MVTAAALWLALGHVSAAPAAPPVQKALAEGDYPWYDTPADSAKPTIPPRGWDWEWVPDWDLKVPGLGGLGNVVALAIVLVAFAAFGAILYWLWRRYEPGLGDLEGNGRRTGGALRIEGLPEGLQPETDDPWSEALRRRQRGDYAGAVVCLFAHQLLELDRLQQVRLVPGRTGRQLVRTVEDAELRSCVEPTLRLFESVYYGHRAPSAPAFEAVWALAEQFQQRVAAGVVA